jgi:hypothetical protein
MFSTPPTGPMPVLVRGHVTEGLTRESIEEGDCVKLKAGTEMMTIFEIEHLSNGKLGGMISGFDNLELKHEGLSVGDFVAFERTDVWVLLKR